MTVKTRARVAADSDAIEVEEVVAADLALAGEALKVYQVQPAPAPVAAWLRNLLGPAVAACRLRDAYPIELRPCGRWGGWAQAPDAAPDRRIAMSNKARLWGRRAVVTTYLHEVAHQLVGGDEHGAHSAVFFSTNYLLLLRAECCACGDPVEVAGLVETMSLTMSLYDIVDLPQALAGEADAGVGRAVSWAIGQARELASSQLCAEDAATEICARYRAWVAQLEAAPAQREAAASARARADAAAAETRAELKSTTRLLRTVAMWLGVAGAAVLAEAFMLLRFAFGGA